MTRKYLFFCAFFVGIYASEAQIAKPGIGAGLSVQWGVNPKSDVILWNLETKTVPMYSQKKLLIGPLFQFKNYQKIQFEGGILYGRSNFINGTDKLVGQDNITVNEYRIPININFNAESPLNFHSAIVYHAGFVMTRVAIPKQGLIMKKFSYFSPSISAGVRLSSEIRSFGRVEYGLTYVKSLIDSHYFTVESDDASPSQVQIKQRTGGWNLNLVYFFSPRVHGWSKSRYDLSAK